VKTYRFVYLGAALLGLACTIHEIYLGATRTPMLYISGVASILSLYYAFSKPQHEKTPA
jgi:hypothetical protein